MNTTLLLVTLVGAVLGLGARIYTRRLVHKTVDKVLREDVGAMIKDRLARGDYNVVKLSPDRPPLD